MRDAFEQLLVGRTLAGRYEVGERIGAGGMSAVYRAVDRRLGRPVAVKVVALPAEDEAEREALRERFRREAGSAARIPHHPNVVQVHDYGTDDALGLDFLVMELLAGRDLKQALAAGPLPRGEALRVLREAARGLAAGHRAGIVHRDVKPANVFLAGETSLESVRILDFGIAKPLEDDGADLTRTGQLPHSPAYASPEQMVAGRAVTPASDVYQLGLIGYEALAGARPFTPEERERIRAGAAVPLPARGAWSDVPAPVRAVVARALEADPARRYPDAAAFAEAVSAAMDEVASPADATHLAPPDDATHLAPPVPHLPIPERDAPPPSPALPAGGVVVSSPSSPTATRERRGLPRAAWIALAVVLVAAVALLAGRRGGDAEAPAAAATMPADTGGLAALRDVFLRLEGSVAARGVPGEERVMDTTRPPPANQAAAVLAAAETEIRAAVHDLNRAWVDGDIGRHVGHYASRVDYYNSRRLPRSGVRRDRTRDLRRYEEFRQIDVGDVRVEFLAPDRARALAQKSWVFRGDGRTRQGQGTQEYVFKRDEDDGRWYVVSEQLLSTSETRTPGAADEG
jgi:serine/threonine protein kinase